MRSLITGLLAALILQGPSPEGFDAKVLRIVDGDTIVVRSDDGARLRIRLINIDTPESHYKGSGQEPWAGMATPVAAIDHDAATAAATPTAAIVHPVGLTTATHDRSRLTGVRSTTDLRPPGRSAARRRRGGGR